MSVLFCVKQLTGYRLTLIGFLLTVMALNANAQKSIKINEPVCTPSRQPILPDNNGIYTVVDSSGGFPGGEVAFRAFLAKEIRWPDRAKNIDVQGNVYVNFVIEENGSLSNFKVLRGIGYGFDEEAIRVLRLSPKWKPGMHQGKTVRQYYIIPVRFTLANK
jgi:protein TonB